MSILFDGSVADSINKEVTEKIAPHLFMFCHYNPGPLVVYGDDAKFMQGTLNLYKLLVDCSLVGSIKKICKAGNLQDFPKLMQDKDTANMLRTALAHNTDKLNGTSTTTKDYEKWLQMVSGKAKMEDVADYKKPLQKLEDIASSTVSVLKAFIDSVTSAKRKQKIVAKWEECIIEFYCRGAGKNIVEGMLRNAYLATRPAIHSDDDGLDAMVAKWIQDEYYHKVGQLSDLMATRDMRGLPQSVIEKVCNRIRAMEAQKEEQDRTIAKYYGCSLNRLSIWNFKDYYCRPDNIRPKLQAAIGQEHKGGTMLPEGIVQSVIFSDFCLNIHNHFDP